MLRSGLFLAAMGLACASAPPPPPAAKPKPASTAPRGPTKTDFATIANKLVQGCVAGGWIERWRADQPDVDVAKPRIHLREFEDKTGQSLDPTYLMSVLERKMRMSGVYEMVTEGDAHDFIGRGRLLRLAERAGGDRVSVYTVTLEMVDPKSSRIAYSCEASVKGEM